MSSIVPSVPSSVMAAWMITPDRKLRLCFGFNTIMGTRDYSVKILSRMDEKDFICFQKSNVVYPYGTASI